MLLSAAPETSGILPVTPRTADNHLHLVAPGCTNLQEKSLRTDSHLRPLPSELSPSSQFEVNIARSGFSRFPAPGGVTKATSPMRL
jgi:hypothetical protein